MEAMTDVNPPTWLPATAYAVLGLLSFGQELSGYELRQWALHSLRAFYWSPAQSQIYRELRRLEGLGHVRSKAVAQSDRPDKTVYALTESGVTELQRWVDGAPVDHLVVKHPTALRVFISHVTDDAGRIVEALDEHLAQSEQTLGQLEELLVGLDDGPTGRHARRVIEWATGIHRADQRGAMAVRAALVDDPREPTSD